MASFTESTLSQAIKPEVSTDSVNTLDTSQLMTSAHILPSHPTSGVNTHNQPCQTPVMCTHTLLHESDNASNFEDRLDYSTTAHNASSFHNHYKSNFSMNLSIHSVPNDVRMHASDYYQRININKICAENLDLFQALAAIDPERANQIQQAHTQIHKKSQIFRFRPLQSQCKMFLNNLCSHGLHHQQLNL